MKKYTDTIDTKLVVDKNTIHVVIDHFVEAQLFYSKTKVSLTVNNQK